MASGCVRYAAVDLGATLANYASSTISWTETLPALTSITVSASLDGETFTAVANGGAIPGLTAGDPLAGVVVTIIAELQTLDPNETPVLESLDLVVVGQEAAVRGPDDWYNDGQLVWTSGLNSGRAIEVKDWDAASRTLTLHLKQARTIAAEDTFDLYPGCTKRFSEDCVTKFNNGVNFVGEPDVPGNDHLARFPDANQSSQ